MNKKRKIIVWSAIGCATLTATILLIVNIARQQSIDQSLIQDIDHARYKHAETILHEGASANACKCIDGGRTPLEILRRFLHGNASSSNSTIPALVLLLKSDPSLSENTEHSDNKDRLALIKELLVYHANVNAYDEEGSTPLLLALRTSDDDVVRILMANGADVNKKDKYGVSPLMASVEGNNPQIVQALLKAGARINDVNLHGDTPLMYAVTAGHPEIVLMLCNTGANTQAQNRDGENALTIARARTYRSAVIPVLLRPQTR